MAYYCKVTVSGTAYNKFESLNVRKRINYKSGSFRLMFPNDSGVYTSTFSVGQEVVIYCDGNSTPTTKIFTGVVEDVQYESPNYNREFITLSGRDYSSRLQDVTALENYSNQEPSVIIKNLIDKYVSGVTYNNVDTTTITISRMKFNQKSVFDCIRDIADYCGYNFWVDEDKDLHFKPQGSVSSGIVANNTNIVGTANFTEDREELFNEVWVYGGKYLSGWQESFTSAGSVATGSIFTMQYKPHNTYVTVGGTKKKGGVFELTNIPASGTQYLVNYDEKQVIFTSGTIYGDNVPGSEAVVVVQYDRGLPIIKYATDRSSVAQYSKRTKIITNNEITDPNQAVSTAKSYLEEHKNPKKQGKIKMRGVYDANLGDTLEVTLPYQGINNEPFKIMEISYDINTSNLFSEQIISFTLNEKIKDFVDEFGNVIRDLRKVQAADIDDTDIISKIEFGGGSAVAFVNWWKVKTVTDLGSSFILSHPTLGKLGGGLTPQPYLGDSRGPSSVIFSGGEWL